MNCTDMDSYTKTSIHCRCMQVHSSKTRGQHAFPSLSALPTPLEIFLLVVAVHGTGINALRDGRCWRRTLLATSTSLESINPTPKVKRASERQCKTESVAMKKGPRVVLSGRESAEKHCETAWRSAKVNMLPGPSQSASSRK